MGSGYGEINYVIWSDVFLCPHCGKEIVFWNAAVDTDSKKIGNDFICSQCGVSVKKASCSRAVIRMLDVLISQNKFRSGLTILMLENDTKKNLMLRISQRWTQSNTLIYRHGFLSCVCVKGPKADATILAALLIPTIL